MEILAGLVIIVILHIIGIWVFGNLATVYETLFLRKPVTYKPPTAVVKTKVKPILPAKEITRKWFVVAQALDKISPAEALIENALKLYKCEYYREVAFYGLKTTKGYPRFDFLVVTPKGEVVIEYDGKLSHSTPEQKDNDAWKEAHCRSLGIPVVRYNAKHYYQLEAEIGKLVRSWGGYK